MPVSKTVRCSAVQDKTAKVCSPRGQVEDFLPASCAILPTTDLPRSSGEHGLHLELRGQEKNAVACYLPN